MQKIQPNRFWTKTTKTGTGPLRNSEAQILQPFPHATNFPSARLVTVAKNSIQEMVELNAQFYQDWEDENDPQPSFRNGQS